MKKKIFKGIRLALVLLIILLSHFAMAQDAVTVEAKGVGVQRADALQDALRAAVAQAVGTAISSQTQVENFMVIQDAISTNTQGYISRYDVVKETPFPDRFEILVRAAVSTAPLKADVNLLAQALGGMRFLVMYDPRNLSQEEKRHYDFAVERVNEYLAGKKYRYIEKARFDQLKDEALRLLTDDRGEASFVQKLGVLSDAQFIILINKVSTASKLEAFDTRSVAKATVEAKAYDNCTAEGLGTIVMESGWKGASAGDAPAAMRSGITEAVNKDFDRLLGLFNSYIGSWINNGTPYELRFYSAGTYRDFRDLRTKLKEDKNFGGQLEVVSANNYTKLNCTFRKKPDELADKVLDYADEVPAFKDKRMDVKLIYGRQLSFAPQHVVVPEVKERQQAGITTDATVANPAAAKPAAPVITPAKPAATAKPKPAPAKAKTPKKPAPKK